MSITFHIARSLHEYTKGKSRVTLEASPKTVADALSLLWSQYPDMREQVVTSGGDIRPDVNILVWNQSIRISGGMSTPLPEDSDVFIVPEPTERSDRTSRP